MPKSKGKGGKNRRRGKSTGGFKRELVLRDEGQEYAQVTRMLGSGRVEVFCLDGDTRMAHIRGKMRKKVWISQGDIVLVSIREFQTEQADVILKYHPEEARALKSQGELPENISINENEENSDEEHMFEFNEDDSDGEDDEDLNIDDI